MKIKNDRKITKLYITSREKLTEHEICFVVSKHNLFPMSIKELTDWNWIIEVRYDNNEDLLSVLKLNKFEGRDKGKIISVKRVFKWVKLSSIFQKEPAKSFLIRVAMGISGLIKKPVKIRITNNRANTWQRELTKIWQKELDKPDLFKKAGIENVIDISPDGELEFCIVKGKNYVVTFFNESIDEYI